MQVLIRVEIENERRFEFYSGEAAGCPPVPRIGEFVVLDNYSGHVVGVNYVLRQRPEGAVLLVDIDTVDSPNGIPSRILHRSRESE